MSRRTPNVAAERAAQNAQTIKSLLKLEGNKTCADCKRNKHPRWASWNLGVFICIRCSGIHRGMGTHISRVKSVDLDSWTDEQLQSALKWGNSRANKYWEAKLAAGHVPSEAKIENFIRTKYESKRWVMEGPIPDPSTLEVDGDDDVPLSLVKEKQTIERSASQRSHVSSTTQVKRNQQPDLFGEDLGRRASSVSRVPAKIDSSPAKPAKPADSLLGLDFFGSDNAPPSRPSSAAPTLQSRPDLKQSILSLYASAPRPQQQYPKDSSGTMQHVNGSPTQTNHFSNLDNALSSLNLSSQKSPPAQLQSKSSAFSEFGDISSPKKLPPQVTPAPVSAGISTGNFFAMNSQPKSAAQQPSRGASFSNSFGGLDSVLQPTPKASITSTSSGLGDMFDFATPSHEDSVSKPTILSPSMQQASVFNLSQQNPKVKPQSPPASATIWSNSDAWGSNNAWGSTNKASTGNQPAHSQSKAEDSGWGSPSENSASKSVALGGFGAMNEPPKVTVDEDFGSWSSAAPAAPAVPMSPMAPIVPATGTVTNTVSTGKPAAGFAGSDDLFSNVWG